MVVSRTPLERAIFFSCCASAGCSSMLTDAPLGAHKHRFRDLFQMVLGHGQDARGTSLVAAPRHCDLSIYSCSAIEHDAVRVRTVGYLRMQAPQDFAAYCFLPTASGLPPTAFRLLLTANSLLRGALAGADAIGDADSGKGIAGDEQAGDFLHALFDGGDASGVSHRILGH